jgi:hypothetical protein
MVTLGRSASEMFLQKHFALNNVNIELEEQKGYIYDTKYIACKTGLSGLWQRFVKQHLKVSDSVTVIFQLLIPN